MTSLRTNVDILLSVLAGERTFDGALMKYYCSVQQTLLAMLNLDSLGGLKLQNTEKDNCYYMIRAPKDYPCSRSCSSISF